MNDQKAYQGMKAEYLDTIAVAEQAYQRQSHTGTRCELLKAYSQAASYAQENGATWEETFLWSEKAYKLAESGAKEEPCFLSYWDAAAICIHVAAMAERYGRKQEFRAYLKCAAAWLEPIREEQSPVEGCDAAAQLRQVYTWLANCE